MIVILINAIIGFTMEFQALQSMNALREMDKMEAKVRREGQEQVIDAEEIVPGDVLLLEAGDLVAADGRIIETNELQINESALTGESAPVIKSPEPVDESVGVADRTNMVFKGTSVTRGKASVVVTAIAMDTQLGNISEMVSAAGEDEIPLNRRLNALTKTLIWVVLGMSALLGLVSLATGQELYAIIQTSIAWAIAAIPEGLPIVASIALAKGMLRLAKHNVIVKRLAAVEALGETNVIFTDKTGTLTENRLTVQIIEVDGKKVEVQWQNQSLELSEQPDDKSQEAFDKIFEISVLCNEAEYQEGEESEGTGDPLEIGLKKFAQFYKPEEKEAFEKLKKVDEDPFDSETKM
ncbi:MAG: HAD-IC family P-type ATPase, partial [Bacteroidia bacterium]|nr:HAD-IC family P-type ATPase [Bacteroidia bacterium]